MGYTQFGPTRPGTSLEPRHSNGKSPLDTVRVPGCPRHSSGLLGKHCQAGQQTSPGRTVSTSIPQPVLTCSRNFPRDMDVDFLIHWGNKTLSHKEVDGSLLDVTDRRSLLHTGHSARLLLSGGRSDPEDTAGKPPPWTRRGTLTDSTPYAY
ncbi:hypothetical protein EYF80_043246 [Liparis tanakae]|uniref:Uncharacterized protein n=1 Tax=Liparis tanakae TaxID=230148 RepID=A0A4Z2G211_9TELE|nr:hypothetical protein EYF80_043246 [Liparis tanakae]